MLARVKDEHVAGFMTCLTLGPMYAIQAGRLPPQAGIWTLGRPDVWKPLVGKMPPVVLEVMRQADELSALRTLSPEEYERKLAEMVERLLDALNDVEEPEWILNWVERTHT